MNRRSVMGVIVMAASLVSAQAVYAAPVSFRVPVHAMFLGTKTVSFKLLNKTASPLKVKVGESEMTLEPGKVTDVKAAIGAQIVNVEATSSKQAGELIVTASSELSGATISIS